MPHHDERPDLAGEHPFGDIGQLILLILFSAVWILDVFVVRFSARMPVRVPAGLRLGLGALCILAGGVLAKKGHDAIFGEVRQPPVVVRQSVFGLIRHPLYAAALLFYLGLTAAACSAPCFVLCIGLFAFYDFIARHEESNLLSRYGEAYGLYMREVPRWIPRLRRKR